MYRSFSLPQRKNFTYYAVTIFSPPVLRKIHSGLLINFSILCKPKIQYLPPLYLACFTLLCIFFCVLVSLDSLVHHVSMSCQCADCSCSLSVCLHNYSTTKSGCYPPSPHQHSNLHSRHTEAGWQQHKLVIFQLKKTQLHPNAPSFFLKLALGNHLERPLCFSHHLHYHCSKDNFLPYFKENIDDRTTEFPVVLLPSFKPTSLSASVSMLIWWCLSPALVYPL